MSEIFEVIPVPVILVDVENAVPVVEVEIDKTGPAGSGSVDLTARTLITTHENISLNPHGTTLVQTNLEASKATVGVYNAGNIVGSKVINFADYGCYVCAPSGTLTFTVTSLDTGQRGGVHILSGATPPIVSWIGVDSWLGGTPIFSANKLTVVTLFNDGIRIIGAYNMEV